MKKLFDYVRDDILHGMPSGCLVTKDVVDFDVGMWQHKSYDNNRNIYGFLRSKWTPHTINLIILDDEATEDDIRKFIYDCSFEVNDRNIYLVYCIAIKAEKVTNDFSTFLKTQTYPMTRFHNKIRCGEYLIFVNDFIKNILLY